MQHTMYLEVLGCLSEKGFSLDELVVKTKEVFEQDGMAGFVALLLMLTDADLYQRIVIQKKAKEYGGNCCDSPCYEAHDRRPRQFRTSIGTVRICWQRLRCRCCGRVFTPLRDFMGLDRHQSKSRELEKLVVEIVSEQSYRRSSSHLELIGEIPVPKSTAHRWVMDSDCDELSFEGTKLQQLFIDGTGFKRRPDPVKDLSNRGEVRAAFGVTSQGDVVPLGAWTQASWQEIGTELREKAGSVLPLADILVSDGELGLAEGLAGLTNDQQRCHWHLMRDLDFYLMPFKMPLEKRREKQRELAGIIGIELPKEDFALVPDEEKNAIEESPYGIGESSQKRKEKGVNREKD